MQTATTQRTHSIRVAGFFTLLLSAAMIVVVFRVCSLMSSPAIEVTDIIQNRQSTAPLPANRGALLDRNGQVMAISRYLYRLYADPKMIQDYARFSFLVGNAIGEDPSRIDRMLGDHENSRYVVLKPYLNDDQVISIQEMLKRESQKEKKTLEGLGLEPIPVRDYPQGPIAGQIVGIINRADHNGIEGAERAFEPFMKATPGAMTTLRDVRRKPVWMTSDGYKPPTDGRDVALSIDVTIQAIAEEEIANTCKEFKGKRGEIIVMHAKTGQLLAMANWPPFNPNDSRSNDRSDRRNRCVSDVYEPGSAFKPFVFAAGLSTGAFKVSDSIDCESRFYVTPFGRRLHDTSSHGVTPYDDVLVFSSNIGMAKIGMKMGARAVHTAVRNFGFGESAATGLPEEENGIVTPLKSWTLYTLTSVPMGQEIAVTPLQLVKGFSAFANGGWVVSPSVLAEDTKHPIRHQVLEARWADHTKNVLRKTVTNGTGKRAQSTLYQIWGKTGTAQVPGGRGGYKPGTYNATFLCGAPLKNPELIVVTVVHELTGKQYYGGEVSAPACKRVIERTLQYMGVKPDVEPAQTDENRRASSPALAHTVESTHD